MLIYYIHKVLSKLEEIIYYYLSILLILFKITSQKTFNASVHEFVSWKCPFYNPSLPLLFFRWCWVNINQHGTHWTHVPSPLGMMRPSLAYLCTGGCTQYQVLEQNGSGMTGNMTRVQTLWNSWRKTIHLILSMQTLLQCSGQSSLILMHGLNFWRSLVQGEFGQYDW